MLITPDSHSEIIRLLKENNALLRAQERRAKWALAGRMVWFGVVIGLPVLFYIQYRDTIEQIFSVSQSMDQIEQRSVDLSGLLEMYGHLFPKNE